MKIKLTHLFNIVIIAGVTARLQFVWHNVEKGYQGSRTGKNLWRWFCVTFCFKGSSRLIQATKSAASMLILSVAMIIATEVGLYAMGGYEGTFEYAIDAPWRMERHVSSDGTNGYGAIPIQISIHDAMHTALDNFDRFTVETIHSGVGIHHSTNYNYVPHTNDMIGIGNFCKVIIKEPGREPVHYSLNDLAEIEMTKGPWLPTISAEPPAHSICRIWNGEDPEQFQDISETSEWHAILWHKPESDPLPGTELTLEIEVHVTRQPWVFCDGSILVQRPFNMPSKVPGEHIITLKNYVRIYYGDDPLPRFDNNWLYGDLHYHSQGSDNEGESAYNYRGAIRAMGAMGLDFLFATEHASNSEQIIDADLDLRAGDLDLNGEIDFGIPFIDVIDSDFHDEYSKRGVLRDMSKKRFEFNHGLIYGKNGVNREAALIAHGNHLPQGYLSHGVLPQIFLGGEVDVIPEVDKGPFNGVLYGNELPYNIKNLCGGFIAEFNPKFTFNPNNGTLNFLGDCDPKKLWEKDNDPDNFSDPTDGYLIRDVQGINKYEYGREHMVYFPMSHKLDISVNPQTPPPGETWCEKCITIEADTPGAANFTGGVNPLFNHGNGLSYGIRAGRNKPTNKVKCFPVRCSECEGDCPQVEPPSVLVPQDTTFIPSNTGEYGGASRRLAYWHKGMPPMLPEIEKKGYAFIAHHLNATEEGSPGPEGPPWSRRMLLQAWKSPSILGLEFWNEDSRFSSRICRENQYGECDDIEDIGHEIGYERNETDSIFGGIKKDHEPKPVNTFRKGFSNFEISSLKSGDYFDFGGYFELQPWDIDTGKWGEPESSVDHKLHNGAYSWDVMNHWGLNTNLTKELDWLKPGEPRRFFMAGGSDAHGDLNYSRKGYFLRTTETNDTAIGKPRNLVFVGQPEISLTLDDSQIAIDESRNSSEDSRQNGGLRKGMELPSGFQEMELVDGLKEENKHSETSRYHTQEQVIKALRKGSFCVTDGPALRIAVDKNGNGRIDSKDVQMGGIVHLYGNEPLKLLVEWKSTEEFGPVRKVDLYVGVQTSSSSYSGTDYKRTYAPESHGTRDEEKDPPSRRTNYSYTIDGRTYTKMEDRYWLIDRDSLDDPLRIIPKASILGNDQLKKSPLWKDMNMYTYNGYHGTTSRSLDLNQFLVGATEPGDRFFIRAFAETIEPGNRHPNETVLRYAFTNPIWVIRHPKEDLFKSKHSDPAVMETLGTTSEEKDKDKSVKAGLKDPIVNLGELGLFEWKQVKDKKVFSTNPIFKNTL